jgi:hypothetical protein
MGPSLHHDPKLPKPYLMMDNSNLPRLSDRIAEVYSITYDSKDRNKLNLGIISLLDKKKTNL